MEVHIRHNIQENPDYIKYKSEDNAIEEYRKTIKSYFDSYETVRDDEGSFIKVYNCGENVKMLIFIIILHIFLFSL
jgi:hypothetical protein